MLRHNKKRNSYIIYEQLLTLATTLAAKDKKDESKFVMNFIRENFAYSTEIGKEVKLFESLLNKKGHEKEFASKVLEETIKQSNNISPQKLTLEKTRLIENVNKHISYELFDIPVKEYKTMASVQILLNESRNQDCETTPEQRVKIKNNLIERMCQTNETKETEKIDNLTFSLMVNKFNQRYAKLMNEDQKHILSAWTNFLITNDEQKMLNVLQEKVNKVKSCFEKTSSSKSQKDAEYFPMLKEAFEQVKKYQPSVNEDVVYEVMRYLDIVEDLQNSEEK